VSRRASIALAVLAVTVVGAVLLPLAYLVLRAASAGADAWEVLLRGTTLELLADTWILVLAVTGAAIAVGIPLAWLVARTDLPGRAVWGTLAALPLVIPSYVAALALLGAFGPRGIAQQLLERPFGVERLPEIYGFPGAFLALTLSTYPYVFLLALAALHGLDPALEEASRALGRSARSTFLHVTLPAIRPAIGAGALLVALYTLSDFGAVSLMQYDALTRAIYLQYRALFDRDPASVLALVLVVLTALVLLVESRYRRGAAYARGGPGVARRHDPVRLGRWRWPALGFCSLVVGFFLVVPAAVLVYWSARSFSLGYGISFAWREALNSLVASSLAAAVAVAAALPVAFVARRRRAAWTRALERAGFAANALPGIVIALALVFFAANYASWVYQSLALLVFAYVVRFFPQALAGVGSALSGVGTSVEEAARGLGRGPFTVFATVTAPLIRSGVLAGAALVFLSAMKELPATLLLRPTGFDTLATEIWKYTSIASYSRAAPPALLLIAVSSPLVYLLGTRRGSDVGVPG
jgi:iron(III) transport system permease protein